MLRWAWMAVPTMLTVICLATAASGDLSSSREMDLRARAAIGNLRAQDSPGGTIGGSPAPRAGRKSVARAMLLSAVLPGLGEIYAGGTRGYVTGGAMATVDLMSVWQYTSNNSKGDDKKDEYQQFADAHYDTSRLYYYVKDTVAVWSGSEDLGFCQPGATYDEAKCRDQFHEHFPLDDLYERIDIDDRYVPGWDDWNPYVVANHEVKWTGWNPGSAIPEGLPDTSPNREEYRSMRQSADDYYSKADRFAWVMVIGRVISIIDTAIMVKMRNKDLAGFGTNPRLAVHMNAFGARSIKVGLKVKF